MARYAANGVERYWLVDPVARTIECLRLVAGSFELLAAAAGNESLELPDAPGIRLRLQELWL